MSSNLASLYERFMASMVDAFPVLVATAIAKWKIPVTDKMPFFWVYWMLVLIVWLIVQAVLLTRSGQTIGKKIFNIRIVSIETGENAGFVTNVLKRSVLNWFLSIIPIYSLVDILFIFNKDRRCVHDKIAGTSVVRAIPPAAA
jgi:uncharacterized RDD family membrane protein YckC